MLGIFYIGRVYDLLQRTWIIEYQTMMTVDHLVVRSRQRPASIEDE